MKAVYLYIAVGGAFGAVARHVVSDWLDSRSSGLFPYATFLVNLTGCLLLGFIYASFAGGATLSREWSSLVMVGFLGAFSTYSTFAFEGLNLMRHKMPDVALLYLAGTVYGGLGAIWLGMSLARLLS